MTSDSRNRIPFQSLGETPSRSRQLGRVASRVFRSGNYVLGEEVHKFEQEFAERNNVQFAIGTANGMDAIEIGLRALSIGPGDEVITTPVTAYATVLAILRAGATPVLCDINPETGLMDQEVAEALVTKRTRAIIVVHLYGHLSRPADWARLCSKLGIHLIEDCAQAHLAKADGGFAGSHGSFGAFSFYPTKNLGAIGDAGAIVTGSSELASESKTLRNYGQSNRYTHEVNGLNSRLDELQAALLRVKLHTLSRETKARQNVAQEYLEGISNPHVRVLQPPDERDAHVYHLFVLKSKHRSNVAEFLRDNGIETLIHYPVSAHQQPAWRKLGLASKPLPCAEKFVGQVFSIPCRPGLSKRATIKVIDTINSFKPK